MTTNYARGASFERRVQDDLDGEGYWTIRAGGSHGIADVVAIKPGQILLVQCKINGVISPADRTELLAVADQIGAVPLVAYRPTPRKLAYRRLLDAIKRGGAYQPWMPDELAETVALTAATKQEMR